MFRGQYLFLYESKFLLESSGENKLVLNCIWYKYVDSDAPGDHYLLRSILNIVSHHK